MLCFPLAPTRLVKFCENVDTTPYATREYSTAALLMQPWNIPPGNVPQLCDGTRFMVSYRISSLPVRQLPLSVAAGPPAIPWRCCQTIQKRFQNSKVISFIGFALCWAGQWKHFSSQHSSKFIYLNICNNINVVMLYSISWEIYLIGLLYFKRFLNTFFSAHC